MKQDECFINLEVKNNIHAKNIIAKKLILEDNTLTTNTHILGGDIKKLYESQKDTNCFTDFNKQTLNILSTNISSNEYSTELSNIPIFYLPTIEQISKLRLNNNTYCICSSHDNKLMYRANIDGKTSDHYFQIYEPEIKVKLNVSNDKVNLSFFTTDSSSE